MRFVSSYDGKLSSLQSLYEGTQEQERCWAGSITFHNIMFFANLIYKNVFGLFFVPVYRSDNSSETSVDFYPITQLYNIEDRILLLQVETPYTTVLLFISYKHPYKDSWIPAFKHHGKNTS
jgi:hypothetical protein